MTDDTPVFESVYQQVYNSGLSKWDSSCLSSITVEEEEVDEEKKKKLFEYCVTHEEKVLFRGELFAYDEKDLHVQIGAMLSDEYKKNIEQLVIYESEWGLPFLSFSARE